jgi:hypothetical protein
MKVKSWKMESSPSAFAKISKTYFPLSKSTSVQSLDLVMLFPSLKIYCLHVVNSVQKVVGNVFDVDTLQGELLVEFVTLPPEGELLVLKAACHFCYPDKLSALHHASLYNRFINFT